MSTSVPPPSMDSGGALSTAVLLKMGSSQGCQGFREMKMCEGRNVSLAVLNLYI